MQIYEWIPRKTFQNGKLFHLFGQTERFFTYVLMFVYEEYFIIRSS